MTTSAPASAPRATVIVFPGTNREQDAVLALSKAGFNVTRAWHGDAALPQSDLVLLPGGFSYGDYLRTGAMAAQSPIMREVVQFANKGGRVLGICNGFQILCESGLLPGALLRNNHLKFNCKFVYLKVESEDSIFTRAYKAGQIIHVPVAHGDGNYFADQDTLKQLQDGGLIAFRYCDEQGNTKGEGNPNGSQMNIAGIYNKAKNVMGMMPHPENAIETYHGSTGGAGLFKSLYEAMA